MKVKSLSRHGFLILMALFFALFCAMESSALARAGGGGSTGSRGSRSFSTPRMPSSPSPSAPRSFPGPDSGLRSPTPGTPGGGFGGGYSRSPFWQGMAGGLAGGLLGNLLFGGRSYAGPMGHTGGGIGLLDIIILCLIGYFAWRFFKKRSQYGREVSSYDGESPARMDGEYGTSRSDSPYHGGVPSGSVDSDLQSGFDQIRRYDPTFSEENFKEVVQDIFFRIQAAWMNRDLNGIMDLLTPEMAENFSNEFGAMKQKGIINKLENIAVRKVEPTEAWQEMGKEYVTVLFTANLLDYTVDDKSNQVLEGDRLNPVKFQEFWTFCRDIGTQRWQLCAINQVTQ